MKRQRQKRESGMTLIEIMVVVAIIGLLMGAVGIVAFKKFQEARLKTTKSTVMRLSSALEGYLLDKQEPCISSLTVLYEKGVINKPPVDVWGRSFGFRCPAEQSKGPADIWSYGPDGRDGTADDIVSWHVSANPTR
jgi:general secretion pathway protein G